MKRFYSTSRAPGSFQTKNRRKLVNTKGRSRERGNVIHEESQFVSQSRTPAVNSEGETRLKMDASRQGSKQRSGRGLLDSLALPCPSTSLTPLRPSAPLYRPQWSSSPPTSPGFGPPKTPDVRHSTRPTYRLPSFKETFGQISFDPHLSDDEVPPSSDFGYTHSEYDCSDPGTPYDRLPSIPMDSPPPEDAPFDRPRRAHRLSVSSEHEEEAILGLLDLRTRPRVSSFASDRSAPDLVSTISPETENETTLFPMTPDGSSTDPVDRTQVKIEEEVSDFRSRSLLFHI